MTDYADLVKRLRSHPVTNWDADAATDAAFSEGMTK